MDSPLATLENVILTSHSIGWTEQLFRDMGRIDCEGALAVRRGQIPAHVVTVKFSIGPASAGSWILIGKEQTREEFD